MPPRLLVEQGTGVEAAVAADAGLLVDARAVKALVAHNHGDGMAREDVGTGSATATVRDRARGDYLLASRL